ncbi:hypothetical protein D3C87_1647590 [compost metagenome]
MVAVALLDPGEQDVGPGVLRISLEELQQQVLGLFDCGVAVGLLVEQAPSLEEAGVLGGECRWGAKTQQESGKEGKEPGVSHAVFVPH